MVANFSLFFAFYVLTPLLPLYLSEHFGATKDIIGLVLSGYTITALLFRPFSGYMVDSFPRKTVLMVCFGAFSIFFAGYLAAGTLLMFTIVRTLHGGPFGALTVSNSTVAIDVLPSSRRTEGIGYYGMSNNLAMAIAPTVGIFIYKLTESFELLFWIALVVACVGWLVDYSLDLKKREKVPTAGFALSWDRFFLLKGWLIGINMVAFGFCFGVWYHRWYWNILHALFDRSDTQSSAGRQGLTRGTPDIQCGFRNGDIFHWIYNIHRPANNLSGSHSHRILRLRNTRWSWKRSYVACVSEYDHQCGT